MCKTVSKALGLVKCNVAGHQRRTYVQRQTEVTRPNSTIETLRAVVLGHRNWVQQEVWMHLGLLGDGARGVREAKHLHRLWGRPQECDPRVGAALRKLFVLAEEAVAWVHCRRRALRDSLPT